jgi:hypothetical protein
MIAVGIALGVFLLAAWALQVYWLAEAIYAQDQTGPCFGYKLDQLDKCSEYEFREECKDAICESPVVLIFQED